MGLWMGGAVRRPGPGSCSGDQMSDQIAQGGLGGLTVTRVAYPHRHVRFEVEGTAYLVGGVPARPGKLVDGDEEAQVAAFTKVDRIETVRQAPRVGQHHSAERTHCYFVPHEPE